MKKWVLVMALLTLITRPQKSVADTLFFDDFNDGNANGWAPSNSANFTWAADAFKGTGGGNNSIYISVHTDSLVNYTYQANLIKTGGGQGSMGGLVLRYKDNNLYYIFGVVEDSRFWFARVDSGSVEPLHAWKSNSFLRPDSNTVKVCCLGPRFYFFANGRFLGKCTDPDNRSPYGSMGIFVQHDREMVFDDILVSSETDTTFTVLPFQDDFEDGDCHGWLAHGPGGLSVENGKLIMNSDGNYVFQCYSNGPYRDFIYEVDLEKRAGPDNLPYGVTMRGQDDSYHSGCFFKIVGMQQFCLEKQISGAKTVIKDWTLNSHINSGTNHLMVQCDGDAVTLYANGQQLGVFSDGSLAEGSIGFFVSGDMEVAFDNVSVIGIPDNIRHSLISTNLYNGKIEISPNPFRSSLAINVPENDKCVVEVFDRTGYCIKKLYGKTNIIWDGTDFGGNPVPNGIYYIQATVDGQKIARQIVKVE